MGIEGKNLHILLADRDMLVSQLKEDVINLSEEIESHFNMRSIEIIKWGDERRLGLRIHHASRTSKKKKITMWFWSQQYKV